MTAQLIAIEGSDGAGKATQTEMLVNYLRQHGFKVATISFPRYHETSAGRMLFEFMKSKRQNDYCFAEMNPKAASYLYAMNRLESMPYLQSLIDDNDVVVFDRWVESNLLHQGGKFKHDSERMEFAKWISDLEYGQFALPVPNVTVYLDLPYTIAYERARKRADEKGERADVVESNLPYLQNSWAAGKLYAIMFNWFVVECIVPEPESQLKAKYVFTPDEVHLRVRDVVKLTRKLRLHD